LILRSPGLCVMAGNLVIHAMHALCSLFKVAPQICTQLPLNTKLDRDQKMKMKFLFAGAGLVAAGLAQAQTNVTIYGIVDVGVEYLTKAATVAGDDEDLFRMTSGNLSSSRIGFRGTEDLGGGMKAIFQLENQFDTDTGALGQGGRLFGRQAYVGLQHSGIGALTLGRQQNSIYDLTIKYDPMGYSNRYSALSHDAVLAGRADNTVKYTGEFGPLTATAMYSFGRDGTVAGAGEVPGESKVGRDMGVGVAYAAGPFGVALAYDQIQGATVATSGDKAQRAVLAGSYTMGPVKGYLGYRWLRDELTAPDTRSNLYWAGVGYDVTPALKLTGVAYFTERKDSGQDPLSVVLSADYSMSKRTDVYMTVGYMRNKDGSAFGLNSGGPVIADENQTGVVAGVRHRF
jgi:predicted porin